MNLPPLTVRRTDTPDLLHAVTADGIVYDLRRRPDGWSVFGGQAPVGGPFSTRQAALMHLRTSLA